MKSNEIIENIINSFNEKTNSHAFLFVTNNIDECFNDIKSIIKRVNCPNNTEDDCKICHTIDVETNPDVIYISSDGKEIKKELVESLIDNCKTMPLLNKYKMYVIKNAEKLNVTSANKLLKFLEEPEPGIVGFYITDNLQAIISTIKSRCEIINYKLEANNVLSLLDISEEFYGDYYNEAASLITLMNNEPKFILMSKSGKLKEKERVDIYNIFELIRKIYVIKFENVVNKEYNNLNYVKILLDLIETDDIGLLSKRINCLNELLFDMNSNVNKELVVNKFFLMWE